LGHRRPNGSGGGLQKPSFAATRSIEDAIADVGSIPIPGSKRIGQFTTDRRFLIQKLEELGEACKYKIASDSYRRL
jgi:hypothetical protein